MIDPVNSADIATLIVAILGVMMAALALVWQALAWRLDGARPSAELHIGATGYGGVAHGKVGNDRQFPHLSTMSEQGWNGQPLIGIKVTNRGRSRVKITGLGIFVKDGAFTVSVHRGFAADSPAIPHWIEGNDVATWWVPLDEMRALVKVNRVKAPQTGLVGMYVTTATGGEIRTPNILDARRLR